MRSPAPTIEPATLGDVDAIQRCVEAAYEGYLRRMDTPPAPMLDDYPALIEQGFVDVARSGDSLLGVLVSWAEPDHYFIDNVAVAPSAQGTGTGTVLLDHAAYRAQRMGLDELRLYTNEVMTENLDFYPRRGFVETHRSTDKGYRRVYFSKAL